MAQHQSAIQPFLTTNGQPLSLEDTLAALGIKSPATLRKLRDLLNIKPIRGRVGGRSLYFSPDDIALMHYVLQHPYETANIEGDAEAVHILREKAMKELPSISVSL